MHSKTFSVPVVNNNLALLKFFSLQRFTKNMFFVEKNPTVVNFPVK